MKKERIIPMFRNKEKTREAFADIGGSNQVIDASHTDGPPNEFYKQFKQVKQAPTELYRRNYDLIQWRSN